MANVAFTAKTKGGAFSYPCPSCTDKAKKNGKGVVYYRAMQTCCSTCGFILKFKTKLKNGQDYGHGY